MSLFDVICTRLGTVFIHCTVNIYSSANFKFYFLISSSIFLSKDESLNSDRLAAVLKGKQVCLYVCLYITRCIASQYDTPLWNARSTFPIKVTGLIRCEVVQG